MNNSSDSILFADDDIVFSDEVSATPIKSAKNHWKILIVDDEEAVHKVTSLVLRHVSFEKKSLTFLHAYSGKEAKKLIHDNPDTAVILLDVVMESDDAGLQVAKYIRETLGNHLVRIVLRTGQPGSAPERDVIINYEINEYKTKTELTAPKLFTTFIASLRNFRDLLTIEGNRLGLEKIVNASGSLFEIQSMEQFIVGVLTQITSLLHVEDDAFYCHTACFAAAEPEGELMILAGTGNYSHCNHKLAHQILPLSVCADLRQARQQKTSLYYADRCVIYFFNKNKQVNMIYLEINKPLTPMDKNLLEVFCANTSIAIDNIYLNEEIENTQKEVVYRMGAIAETRSKETGNHVKRVAEYSSLLALKYGLPSQEVALIKQASPMHDIGKVGVPDSILKKPSKLTAEEWEIMKTHSRIGHMMLCDSHRPIMVAASIIALEHHEKWDGSGYPRGLAGEDIHLYGRITSVADVFDALGSDRYYKKAWPLEKIIAFLQYAKGKFFEPALVDLLLDNLPEFLVVRDSLSDM